MSNNTKYSEQEIENLTLDTTNFLKKTSAGTASAGEDLQNDVLKISNNWNYTNITTATTTLIKSGVGRFGGLVINKAVATAVITIYDNTAGSGTLIGTITYGAGLLNDPPLTWGKECNFTVGLTVVTSQATDITVLWK